MKSVYHKANSRGYANHGWLKSYHTFSFANYHDPDRIHFGALRVLNDDTVEGGRGFGSHAHHDMEIITIPLEGDLRHKDNMGNEGVISKGEVQVMSAGTGIVHSEMNANLNKAVKFLQIWIIPRATDVTPRYDELDMAGRTKPNSFQQIVSPSPDDDGVWVHQDAWFNMATLDKNISTTYTMHHTKNSTYVFVIKGIVKVGDRILGERDGYGIWEAPDFNLEALENADILLMEVPMDLPG